MRRAKHTLPRDIAVYCAFLSVLAPARVYIQNDNAYRRYIHIRRARQCAFHVRKLAACISIFFIADEVLELHRRVAVHIAYKLCV